MGLYFNIALFLPFNKINNKTVTVIGEVLEADYSNEYYNRYLINVKEVKLDGFFLDFKCYANTAKDEKFFCGDIVKLTGNFTRGEESRNYRGFNYKNYLLQRKIFGIIKTDDVIKIGENVNLNIFIYKAKQKIVMSIKNMYKDQNTAELLECILIGQNINNDYIKESFKTSNLSHILAISGMHVSYIIFGIDLIKVQDKKLKLYFKLIFLNLYLVITGVSVSCLRACLMYSILIISKLLYRKNNIYITTLNTIIFSIVYNVYNIFNAGMWLSYGGMLGIILFHKLIYKMLI